jgi:predicted HNH restriction endonuclease
MGKRVPYTPRSQIVSAIRKVWLRSRERAQTIKQTGGRCCLCDVKQSSAKGKEMKLAVHHAKHRPDWDRVIAVIREEVLQTPEDLWPLCPCCHDELHEAVDNEGITQDEYVKRKQEERNKSETEN